MATKNKTSKIVLMLMGYVAAMSAPGLIRDTGEKCGAEERWPIKVLIDPAHDSINFNKPIATTVAQLRNIPPESKVISNKIPRLATEKKFFVLQHVRIMLVKSEDDDDFHLVIKDAASQDDKETMIAEVPYFDCGDAKSSGYADLYKNARNTVLTFQKQFKTKTFTIKGVGFFDFNHRQTGHAPNNLEIHPVLSIDPE